jgi:hypothetical protein
MKGAMRHKKTRKDLMRHAKRRATSRYDSLFTNNDINLITDKIQQGLSLFCTRISKTRSLHIIQYNDKYIRVVYDKTKKTPATFLPIYDKRGLSHEPRNFTNQNTTTTIT